jgi:hypothetical protein
MYKFRLITDSQVSVIFRVSDTLDKSELIKVMIMALEQLEAKDIFIYDDYQRIKIRPAIYIGISDCYSNWYWVFNQDGKTYPMLPDFRQQIYDANTRANDLIWLENYADLIIDSVRRLEKKNIIGYNTLYAKLVKQWCDDNGFTEPELAGNQWWAIPEDGVLPVPISALIRSKIINYLGHEHYF